MKKLISIVIPGVDEEEVLDEAQSRLQNVMNNCSNYDFEVIIVENGSWDSSFEKFVQYSMRKIPDSKLSSLSP